MPPRKKAETAPEPPEGEVPDPGAEEGTVGDETVALSNWQFIDVAPTPEQVLELLGTLDDCYGVPYVEFADYVQALPQSIKITKRVNGRKEVETRDSWAIYMSVSGRVKMAERICRVNEWGLDYEPEPVTPTGVPGMLQMGDGRIVYREYAVFYPYTEGKRDEPMGRKPGMAWVPYSGGTGAKESNPYEKVETAARGRALGAWGIGILPGSGIASLEEMQAIAGNQRAMRDQAQDQGDSRRVEPGQQRKPKEELIQDALTAAEQLRQIRGLDEEQMTERLVRFLGTNLGIVSVFDAELGAIDWARVKPGQVQLLTNSLLDGIQQARNERAEL